MPESNPWSGELKARRKKSRTADKEGTNTSHSVTGLELQTHLNEPKDNIKPSTANTLSSTVVDNNEKATNHNLTATPYTNPFDTNSAGTHHAALTHTNISTKKDDDLLNQKLKILQKEKDETNKEEDNTPLEENKLNSNQIVGDEDSEILKTTRKNLKPVLQPFKRSDSGADDTQTETPVDRLIRQGSLENTSEQSKPRHNNSKHIRTMDDLAGKNGKTNWTANEHKI